MRITKRMIQNGDPKRRLVRHMADDDWISNGSWLVRASDHQIDQRLLESVPMQDLGGSFVERRVVAFLPTPILYHWGEICRVYRTTSGTRATSTFAFCAIPESHRVLAFGEELRPVYSVDQGVSRRVYVGGMLYRDEGHGMTPAVMTMGGLPDELIDACRDMTRRADWVESEARR